MGYILNNKDTTKKQIQSSFTTEIFNEFSKKIDSVFNKPDASPKRLIPNNTLKVREEAAIINACPHSDAKINYGAYLIVEKNPEAALGGDCVPFNLGGVDENSTKEQVKENLNQQFKIIADQLDTNSDGQIKKIVIVSHGIRDPREGGATDGSMLLDIIRGKKETGVIHIESVAFEALKYIEEGGELILVGCKFCPDTPDGKITREILSMFADIFKITIKVTTSNAIASDNYATGDMIMFTPDGTILPDNSIDIRKAELEKQLKEEEESSWWNISQWF